MNLKAIGKVLRQQREIKGLDYKQVARAAKVHANTVRGIESGNGDHCLMTFESIGNVLGLSLLDIVRAGKGRSAA